MFGWILTLSVVQLVLFLYFVAYSIYALTTGLFSRRLMKKIWKSRKELDINNFVNEPLTIIVPAYNEEVVIVDSVKNMMGLEYPQYEVIVVNDGSTDSTLAVLKKEFNLVEFVPPPSKKFNIATEEVHTYYRNSSGNLIVIDKENGGKADAFNAAINITTTEYIVTVDADTVLTNTALQQLMYPVVQDRNVVAVGAQVCVANDSSLDKQGEIKNFKVSGNYFSGVQALEYMKTFLIYRTGHNAAGATLLISGACGLFNTQLLVDVGGFDKNSVCEDIEITMRIQEHIHKNDTDKRIDFVPNPIAWTEVPSTYSSLAKQRSRWFRGSTHSLWKYKHTLANPSMGSMGFYSVPTYWLFGYLAPFAQAALVINLIFFRPELSILVWGIVVACIINVLTISIMKFTDSPVQGFADKVKLFWYGIVEMVWMQFFYMAVNLKAAFDAARGKRQWDKFDRIGFNIDNSEDGSNSAEAPRSTNI